MTIVAIQDANILIDCARIGILEFVFQLSLRFKTTDLVWAEISNNRQRQALQIYIDQGRLQIVGLTAGELLSISTRMQANAGLSLEDCSVWHLTEKYRALLLTGDGKLRKICRQEGLRVHGILWLLDQLLQAGLLSKETACQKIRALQASNIRLPSVEVTLRVRTWCEENDTL